MASFTQRTPSFHSVLRESQSEISKSCFRHPSFDVHFSALIHIHPQNSCVIIATIKTPSAVFQEKRRNAFSHARVPRSEERFFPNTSERHDVGYAPFL